MEQTNTYAQPRGNHGFSVRIEDIYSVVGILLFSGYHSLPRRLMHCRTEDYCDVKIIRETCRRNRFDEILRFLHLPDNSKADLIDRLYKVRPLFEFLNKNFKIVPPMENCSVDESIFPYYGRNGAKQFVWGKPIHFGFKPWCLAESSGYLINAEPYEGASTKLPKILLGRGGDVVV
ncbi:hypothetical protein J437_LFUL009550 [Ladona fulva]|uniref:PiggyBac transposable element-derived protein domain-containing protein n=1 Tax=Ladona fulva TaxID=123851 RepID=A0A8K0K820_LADFU|nr:hypothetical protein J437_LFUL009550 [Ladona fulva]